MNAFRGVGPGFCRLIGLYPLRQYVEPLPQIILILALYIGIPWLNFINIMQYYSYDTWWTNQLLYPQFEGFWKATLSLYYGYWVINIMEQPALFLIPFAPVLKMIGFARAVTLIPRFLFWQPRPQQSFPTDDTSTSLRLVDGGIRRSIAFTIGILVVGSVIAVCLAGVLMFASLLGANTLGILSAPVTGPFGIIMSVGATAAAIETTMRAVAIGLVVVPLIGLLSGYIGGLEAAAKAIRTFNITVQNADEPLATDLRLLCARAGVEKPPRVGFIENEDMFNAFAIGLTQQDALIAISTPLAAALTHQERLAVLAHELGHVINRDMARMTFARSFQGGLTWFLIYQRIKILVRWLFTFVSEIAIMKLSRSREYWADAMGAALTSPDAMIGALRKIAAHTSYSQPERRLAAIMFRASATGLFDTHPPIGDRITALQNRTYLDRLALRFPNETPAQVASPAPTPIPGVVNKPEALDHPLAGAPGAAVAAVSIQPLLSWPSFPAWDLAGKATKAWNRTVDAVRRNPWRAAAVALMVALLIAERSVVAGAVIGVRDVSWSAIDAVAGWSRQKEREQLEARERAAGDLEARLTQRATALDGQDRQLREREAALRSQQADLSRQTAAATARDRSLADQEAKLTSRKAALDSDERQLRDREGVQRAQQSEVERQRALLATRDRGLADLDAKLTARGLALDTQERQLREREAALRVQQPEIERQRTALTNRDRTLADLDARLTARALALDNQERQLRDREAAVRGQPQDAGSQRSDLGARERGNAELETRLNQRAVALDAQERQLREREAAVREQQASLDRQSADLAARAQSVAGSVPPPSSPVTDDVAERAAAVEKREMAVYTRELDVTARERNVAARERGIAAAPAVTAAPSATAAPTPPKMYGAVARSLNGQFYVPEKDTTQAGAERKALAACGRYGRCEVIARLATGENECFAVAYVPGRPDRWTGVGRTLYDAGENATAPCEERYVDDCTVDKPKNFCLPK